MIDQTFDARLGMLYGLRQLYGNNPAMQNEENIQIILTILSDIANAINVSNRTLTRMVNLVIP